MRYSKNRNQSQNLFFFCRKHSRIFYWFVKHLWFEWFDRNLSLFEKISSHFWVEKSVTWCNIILLTCDTFLKYDYEKITVNTDLLLNDIKKSSKNAKNQSKLRFHARQKLSNFFGFLPNRYFGFLCLLR